MHMLTVFARLTLLTPTGQTYAQLMEMQENINAQLASGQGDPEYWEQVLSRLTIHAAKARLREIQTQLMEVRLDKMERQANRVNVAKAMGWARERLGEMEEDEQEEREEGEPGGGGSWSRHACPEDAAGVLVVVAMHGSHCMRYEL